MGSTRVPRVGAGVLAIAGFSCAFAADQMLDFAKIVSAWTPKPTRETRALPRIAAPAHESWQVLGPTTDN